MKRSPQRSLNKKFGTFRDWKALKTGNVINLKAEDIYS